MSNNMSAVDYLKMPPPAPVTQPQSPPSSSSAPLSLNDQIKMCAMKHKIMKNFAEMFQLANIVVSPFKNALAIQFLCILIEKYKNDMDHGILVRLHGIIDNAFRTTSVTLAAIDECVYLLTNPKIVEAVYMFTQ